MEKKKIGTLFFLATLTIALLNVNLDTKNKAASLLELNNIEALAGEDVSGHIDCHGTGTLYCYLTNKSEYKEIIITQ